MPQISIIMGAYNAERTLESAIESIITQSITDWEFVICDDASTDSTPQILDQYRNDPRFVILRNEKNIGLGASLNRCIDRSKSELLARQDADDISLPHRFERQLEYLKQYPEIDVLGTLANIADLHKKVTGLLRAPPCPTLNDWLSGSMIIHPTAIMKRETVIRAGIYNPKALRIEDYDLWLRILAIGGKIENLPEVLYTYEHSFGYYSKIGIRNRILDVVFRLKNFKLLRIPFYLMIYAFRPIIGLLIPKHLLYFYYRLRFRL